MKEKKQTISTFFFLIVGFVVIFATFILVAKERKRAVGIQKEIEILVQEAVEIEKEGNILKEKISYLSTKDFYEREAKENLNYQKEGEDVVIIRRPIKEKKIESEGEVKGEIVVREPHYKVWWRYFFGNKK
ncbi:MAG: septum formation initiator family protein [Candidatus Moranbacteria bacterium]|nr:septum formation initiator family protein [Candidatus Moranbacteria bacterium]